MGRAAETPRMTYADYLAFEEASDTRHEFVHGEVYAMTGGTSRHAAIALNIGAALKHALRGKPCRPTSGDQRIRVPATGAAFYADVAVVCDRYEHADDDPNGLINPTVIVEVLSPSTEAHDRGTKFEHYRRLPSLQHYLLVSADEPLVEHRRRNAQGWQLSHHTDGRVELDALGVGLELEDIYDDLAIVGGGS